MDHLLNLFGKGILIIFARGATILFLHTHLQKKFKNNCRFTFLGTWACSLMVKYLVCKVEFEVMKLDSKTEELRVRFTAGPYIFSGDNLVNINELQSRRLRR